MIRLRDAHALCATVHKKRYRYATSGIGNRKLVAVARDGGKVSVNKSSYSSGNTLLDLLISIDPPSNSQTRDVIHYRSGETLLDTNTPIEAVFFPVDMMISITTLMRDGSEIEVGTIGREGMSGLQLVLGIDHVPGKALCQIAGSAVRIGAIDFMQWVDGSQQVRSVMLRYVQATMNAQEISIACNALHSIAQRCARWLLITQDRVNRSDFILTQEFLAMMLGVRRATVNSVGRELQEQRAITYARGNVKVMDRAALKRAVCECYQLTIDHYSELLKQPPYGQN